MVWLLLTGAVQVHHPDLQDTSYDTVDPVESSVYPLNLSEMGPVSVRLSTHNNNSASRLTGIPKKLDISSTQHPTTGVIMESAAVSVLLVMVKKGKRKWRKGKRTNQ